MYDRFNRRIHYLRISVTDCCNLACAYCRPAAARAAPGKTGILTADEIAELVATAVTLGVDKIRLTGGEPLLREGIVALVARIRPTGGLQDLAMTTNGLLLAPCAAQLRQAGLDRVNISLDTLDPVRFTKIAGGGDLDRVLAGIRAAVSAGYRQVKLNCVVESLADEPDARSVADFGRQQGLEVQFIRRMDLAAGRFWPVVGGNGGRCDRCNRLRVSCDGRVYPCLFNDLSYSIRDLGVEAALRLAVGTKPATGTRSSHTFSAIGG